MTPAEIISLLETQFGAAITGKKADTLDPFVSIDPARLVEVCTFLRDDPRLKFELLNDISGVDYLETDPKKAAKAGFEPHIEVVYHMSSFSFPGRRFTIKLILPRWKDNKPGELPEVPSVTGVWRTADWQEREVYDLIGVFFKGHPDLVRILLSDDWVGHPLRKDYEFPLEYHGIRCR
ncbi:MAG TPA: NADH-quinone oxidoreductase subunit C [Gemmata sp.]|jgi:NADH-quinone oxidoreductase subunit C|nr:NADH-quinone oxidoreductase subunit C [Gemmata sp.]